MVVVESAVTSIYICYAEDPLLIHRWDTDFFNQMSETLHQRLQHRSARAREVLTHNQLDDHMQESIHIWKISVILLLESFFQMYEIVFEMVQNYQLKWSQIKAFPSLLRKYWD